MDNQKIVVMILTTRTIINEIKDCTESQIIKNKLESIESIMNKFEKLI